MSLDFTEFFVKYEKLAAEVEQLFAKVSQAHAQEVRCGRGCSDCCYALFDLSLIEALYLNHHFNRLYDGAARNAVLERADVADRAVHRLKRVVFKASQDGVPAAQILEDVAKERLRCPLLNSEDLCDLYEHRPLTCRLYGLPVAIGGQARTCGKSGFKPGKPYPTVHMDRLQDRLAALSRELVESLPTRHPEMWDLLLPPSMALMTDFDEKFLGIDPEGTKPVRPAPAPAAPAEACAGCAKDATSCGGCDPVSITLGQAAGQAVEPKPKKPKKADKPKKPRSGK